MRGWITMGSRAFPSIDSMAKYSYGDIVRARESAPPELRPGSKAWIVGVEETRAGHHYDQFPPGTIYTIEFEDGTSTDIHEIQLLHWSEQRRETGRGVPVEKRHSMDTNPRVHLPNVLEALGRLEITHRIVDAQSLEDRDLNDWIERAFPLVGSQIDWSRIPEHRCLQWSNLEDLVPKFRKLCWGLHAEERVVVMWANGLCPCIEMALGDVARIAREIFEEHETSFDVFVFHRREGWLIEMHHEGTLCIGTSETHKSG